MNYSSENFKKPSSRSIDKTYVIVIDGPAASGKSTAAYLLAKKLGFVYMDTGAMYRALTWKALQSQVDPEDAEALSRMAHTVKINILSQDTKPGVVVYLDGEDVSTSIRTAEINRWVSVISKVPGVRQAMLKLQKRIAREKSIVAEGRDMGTVVFPQADTKIFLTASLEERVNRRWMEFKAKGEGCTRDTIAEELKMRDRIDSEREIAPLKKAADAILIDNTNLNIEETIKKLYDIAKQKLH